MPEENANSDDVLFHVLKECKTLPRFLDSVFGFLKRRTDFYIVADGPSSAVGLPLSMAENVVKQTFYKWQMQENLINLHLNTDKTVPIAIEEVEVVSSPVVLEPSPELTNQQQNQRTYKEAEKTSSSTAECYNGAVRDKYMWSQGIQDLDITIILEGGVSPKHLQVVFEKQHILVHDKVRKVDILAGELLHTIRYTEVTWSVDVKAHRMEVHVEKLQESWWDRLFTNEDVQVDVHLLDCSRPFEELPEHAQAKIAEVQYNQECMQAGLPTIKQQQMEISLRKAWNAEGSPFSGPFDIAKVIMEPQLMNIKN